MQTRSVGGPGPGEAGVGLVADSATVEELLPVHFNASLAHCSLLCVGHASRDSAKGLDELRGNDVAGKALQGSDDHKPDEGLVEGHDDLVEELVGTVQERQVSGLGFGNEGNSSDACNSEGLLHFKINILSFRLEQA